MFKDALHYPKALIGALLASGLLAMTAGAANAEELELTVYGMPSGHTQIAFQAQMKAYSRALDREIKQAVKAELRDSVAPRLLLAGEPANNRG
jgi:hypothetical protein